MSRKQSSSYDPSKAEWSGNKITDWDASKWKQWKPKATGTDYPATMEREYLRIKWAVQQANTQLDADKVRVKLKLTSANAIGLQGTFPCKEGEVGKNGSSNKQYTISIGTMANDIGVKTAIAKARELDWQLTTKTFQWTPELLGKQAQKIPLPEQEQPAKLISELIEEYEKEFWKTHDKNRQSMNNWKNQYLKYLNKLPLQMPLSDEALTEACNKSKPNTMSRYYLVWQLKKFCNFCNFNGSKILDSYATKKPNRKKRAIPSDDEVIKGFKKIGEPLHKLTRKTAIQPEQWQWIYGMLATYGLRGHELFAVDLEAFVNPTNIHHLVTLKPELTEGTKTGERSCGIPPLHPEWVKLFDLKNVKPILLNGELDQTVGNFSEKFKKVTLGFAPYNLRHAYAIRGHKLRIPIKTMADYMGHTVQEHTGSYQKWMSEDTNIEIYKEVVLEKQAVTREDLKAENELLKAEITALKSQVASLQTENETLRKLLIEHQLEGLLTDK